MGKKEKQPQYETIDLDSRRTGAFTITLWWVKNTLDTFVTVLDVDQEPPVEHWIDVPKGVLPHHVYNHALAYIPQEPEAA